MAGAGSLAKGESMRSRWLVFLVALWVLSFPLQGGATIYMISYEPNWGDPIIEADVHWAALYTVENTSGVATKVGDIKYQGSTILLTDIAYSPNTGNLYAINSDDTGSQLYTLDYLNPVSGVVQATLLHTLSVQNLQGLALAPDGEYLYAGSGTSGTEGENPGALYTIYPSNGSTTLVGSMGSLSPTQPIGMGYGNSHVYSGDLDFDNNKTIYGSVSSATADHSADIFSLSILDPSSGKATLMGSGFQNGAITGLAFMPNFTPMVGGVMYGCDYSGAFYQVDTDSGDLTFIGSNAICQVGMTYAPPPFAPLVHAPALMLLLD
jgi:hypothetical protein